MSVFVVGVDGALGAALVERAQDPAPVAFDEEPDDGFPDAPGIAHRDEAAVHRGLVGIDPRRSRPPGRAEPWRPPRCAR